MNSLPLEARVIDLLAAEQAGAADVGRWRRDPTLLPSLPLGAFDAAPLAQVVLRRVLLSLRIPPRAVAPLVLRSSRAGLRSVLESYCYWRGARKALRDRDTWRRLTQGTTILMYHAFGRDGEPATTFVVPGRVFERQMRWLVRRRPAIALDELLAYRRSHRLPPAGAVVVTIDDGYVDTRTLAHPVLHRLGIPATLFVVTSKMGSSFGTNMSEELDHRPLLSWSEAIDLHRNGLKLGAHTRTHPMLSEVAPDQLEPEIAGSRADLERALGEPVDAFAYPYGRWNAAAAEAVQQAGFGCALTVKSGRNCASTPPYALRRTAVRGSDSTLRFALGVTFGDARILEDLASRLLSRGRDVP